MALIMHLLKPDTGRAAVVLPDGFLFGEGVKSTLKQELLKDFNLHTVVRLPRGVFAPYTSIATNILFFEKGGPTKDIWFFEHPYPEGYKSYSRSKPLTIGEFDLEKAWWGGVDRKNRQTTEHAWKVSADEITARNYNLDCKNPHQKQVELGDPDELMIEYEGISNRLLEAQNALKTELLTALTAHPVAPNTNQNTIALLEKHFDTAFFSLEGVVRLRELILTLAMQGKLVEHDPNDQPACKLLQDIEVEKQRLIDEKKIRNQKPLPSLTEEEIPYELPRNWSWTRLGVIGFTQTGTTPKTSDHSSFGNDIPFIKPGDIYSDCINYQNEGLSKEGAEKTGRLASIGTSLMVCIGTIGKTNTVTRECSFNQQINAITPYVKESANYIQAFLRSAFFQKMCWKLSSSTTIAILNKSKWESIPVAIAPLPNNTASSLKSMNLWLFATSSTNKSPPAMKSSKPCSMLLCLKFRQVMPCRSSPLTNRPTPSIRRY